MHNKLFNNGFWRFQQSVNNIQLPIEFTFPFHYTPHPLCVIAASELQNYITTQAQWDHNFGIDAPIEGTNIGKMFGVMVIKSTDGELGYLAAFSGKLGGKNNYSGFVPPIVDLLQEDGFYRKGEDIITAINQQIESLENALNYLEAKTKLQNYITQSQTELTQYKQAMKLAKKERDHERQVAAGKLTTDEFELLKEKLKQLSLKWQFDYKILVKQWDEKIASTQIVLAKFDQTLEKLRDERKTMSAALQSKLFDQYRLLNALGEIKTVAEIFADTDKKIAPAGAGDCAAPKLLQYAYQHQMTPIAMAEFWWGQSPKSEIRHHGHFYPSCRSKCLPILGHMLQGIEVEPNPILQLQKNNQPYIVFDDSHIGVVHKPADYLSVPGKTSAPSVYTFLKEKFPHAKGPIMVHRLDMSTSGLMVFAKTMEAYHHLQKQFADRTVKKRYIALLQGEVTRKNGIIDLPLRPDLDDRPRQLVCAQYGKRAITKFEIIDVDNGQTRMHFTPITGRTHQLRVHSAHHEGLNCPIAGDDLYGQKADRLYLHAEFLRFKHPITNKTMEFNVPAPF